MSGLFNVLGGIGNLLGNSPYQNQQAGLQNQLQNMYPAQQQAVIWQNYQNYQIMSKYRDTLANVDLTDFNHNFIYWLTMPNMKVFEEVIIFLSNSGYENRHTSNVSFGPDHLMIYIAFESGEAATLFLLTYDGIIEVEKINKE